MQTCFVYTYLFFPEKKYPVNPFKNSKQFTASMNNKK